MVATSPVFFGQPSFPMPFTPQAPQPAMSFSQGASSQPAASGASVLTINLPNATANNYAGGAATASVGQNAPAANTFNPANPQQGLYDAYNQAQAAIGNYMNMGRALQAQAFAMQHLPLLPVPGMIPPPMPPMGTMPPMNLPALMGPPMPQFQPAPPMPNFQLPPGMPMGGPIMSPGMPPMGMPPGMPPMGPMATMMPQNGPMGMPPMGMPPGAFPPPPPPPFPPNMMGPQPGGPYIFPQPPGMM